MATESRSQQRAARVSDQWQATRRLWCTLFHGWERGSDDPPPHSHHVLRLGGLANKENYSKQNRKIAGNSGCGGGVCQKTVCHLAPFNCRTLPPVWQQHELAAFVVANNVDVLAL